MADDFYGSYNSPRRSNNNYKDDRYNDKYNNYEQQQYEQTRYNHAEDDRRRQRDEYRTYGDRRRQSPPRAEMRDNYQGRSHYEEHARLDERQRREEENRERFGRMRMRDGSPPRDGGRSRAHDDYSQHRDAGRNSRAGLSQGEEDRAEKALVLLREACLKRGVAGIKGFGRMFRLYDDNRDRKLNMEEFRNGVRDYGVTDLKEDDLKLLFRRFDRDDSGHISYDELLHALRPPMNEARQRLIKRAFAKLDQTGDGIITVADLKHTYDVTQHPKYKSGEMTQQQVLLQFLDNFEAPRSRDGKVTYDEFLNYYSGVSASIDKDVYFDLMMRTSWGLDKPASYKKAQAFLF